MKKSTIILRAMNDIRADYILDGELSATNTPVRVKSNARCIRIIAVAATVTALAVATVIGMSIMKQSGDTPPMTPPITGTQDAELPTDEENTSAEGNTFPADSGEEETAAPLNGSYSTDLYTVAEIDGKHYISFADGNEKPANSGGNAMVIQGIYFNSIEEMRRKFLEGDFTADEVKNLKSQLTLTDKGFEIPDMTNLYDAVLPEGWSVYRVCLDGNSIFLSVRNDRTYDETAEDYEGEHGFIAIHTEKYFNVVYQNNFLSYVEKNKENLVQGETKFHDIPCMIFERMSNGVLRKDIVMEVPVGEGAFDSLVKYRIQQSDIEGTFVPYSVSMYGELFGRKIEIFLSGFESELSSDSLSSFGITPLEIME